MENRTLHTEFFTISLEQIDDVKILEALQHSISFNDGVKAIVYDEDECSAQDCIIIGLLIKDKRAIILKDYQSNPEIVYFSAINIDI